MKLIPFTFLTVLAVIYAGLTLTESLMYRSWEQAMDQQKRTQYRAAYYQKVNGFIEQLLRRMALDSQRDPALAQVLRDNQIKVVVNNPQPARDPLSAQPNPGEITVPSDKNTAPSPTPSH